MGHNWGTNSNIADVIPSRPLSQNRMRPRVGGWGDKQESFIGLFIRLSAHGPSHSDFQQVQKLSEKLGELPLELTQPPRKSSLPNDRE